MLSRGSLVSYSPFVSAPSSVALPGEAAAAGQASAVEQRQQQDGAARGGGDVSGTRNGEAEAQAQGEQQVAATALLDAEGSRMDARHPEECRPAFIRMGTVSQAAGSAYAEFGGTKVMVSIYGPRESDFGRGLRGTQDDVAGGGGSGNGRLHVTVSLSPFAAAAAAAADAAAAVAASTIMEAQRRQRDRERERERHLTKALYSALCPAVQLHTFPKATLDVAALVLEGDGSEQAVLTVCTSVALADAGVPLWDLVSSVSLVLWHGQLLLDPTRTEEDAAEGRLTVALMPTADTVTVMSYAGRDLSPQQLTEALDLCTQGCLKLSDIMRATVREDVEEQQLQQSSP